MSHVSLRKRAGKVRSLFVLLAVVGVVGLAQGAAAPLARQRAEAAPSAPLARQSIAPPAAEPRVFLPHVSRRLETPPRFQTVESPNFGSEVAQLTAVDLLSPTDGWAVGSYDGGRASLTLRWDGVHWTHVPCPNPDPGAPYVSLTLTDVVAIDPDDAWAAVDNYPPYLLHWDAQAWTVVPLDLPSISARIYRLAASGPTDVWAVGFVAPATAPSFAQTLILHWDGVRWSRVPSPNHGSVNVLNSVAARAPNDAWAVGQYNQTLLRDSTPLFLHWDGAAWSEAPLPDLSPRLHFLTDVTVLAANDAWAVGYQGGSAGSNPEPESFHWNGGRWESVPLPALSSSARPYSVAALAPNHVLASGTRFSDTGESLPWLMRWNGAAWTLETSIPGLTTNHLPLALDTAAPSTVVAVGTQPTDVGAGWTTRPWSLHWNGTAWREPAVPKLSLPRNRLHGIDAFSPWDMWAVGDWEDVAAGHTRPLLLHWDGQAWTRVLAPVVDAAGGTLAGVGVATSMDVWAVGGRTEVQTPLLLHWDGRRWAPVSLPERKGFLHAIQVGSSDDAWAVGYEAGGQAHRPLLFHWDGRAWSAPPMPPLETGDADLFDVQTLGYDDVWAVGYDTAPASSLRRPLILHWDGVQWSRFPAPAGVVGDASLSCVASFGPDNLWAMGRQSHAGITEVLALHWDGQEWTPGPSLGLGAQYSAVSDCDIIGDTEIWAVGSLQQTTDGPTETLVIRGDGARWTRIASSSPGSRTNYLSALTWLGESLWTVGYSAPAGWPSGASETLIEWADRNW